MTNEQTSEDLLIMDESYERASTGKRFANYLIDIVGFYLLIIGVGFALVMISPALLENLTYESTGSGLINQIIYIGFYAIYMSIIETLFKGKSLGKLITKTRAINLDGSKISTGTAFARGFCRAVPFCAFSALGNPSNPWQDRWTNTMVINEKMSEIN